MFVWRREWTLPPVHEQPGGQVSIDGSAPTSLIARLAAVSEAEVARRLGEQNDLFLLRVDGQPAAYGWSAAGRADMGELGLSFQVPAGERYLWDFVTMPEFRGRRLYPLLLQEILRRQRNDAAWFWIGHEPGNLASRSGILRAGFQWAGDLWRLPTGSLVLRPRSDVPVEVARRGSQVLGLDLLLPGSSQSVSST
jgi:hypothetical protein